MSAGYSGTQLLKKLGIKANFRVAFIHAPEHYPELLGDLPDGVTVDNELSGNSETYDFVHAFYVHLSDYSAELEALKSSIKKDGMLWISWYKKASMIPTDLTEDVVRDVALEGGLVDVKVAAVDEQWSGLKLVYRLDDR